MTQAQHPAVAHLRFDNSWLRHLPEDPRRETFPRAVRGAMHSRVSPTPVSAPRLLAWSPEVATLLDLPADPAAAGLQDELAQVFAGNRLWPGMETVATRYGGHQFGHWAGQLGDGRAMSLGEVLTTHAGRQELQLKGAGPTPYSRRADGRAVLRSSLREFICSEAMHHLGVPTTRALSLVATGDPVQRDMFYDGRPEMEPGAIVCRVAPSFLRFGHFEMPAADGDADLLARVFTYAVEHHFPGFSSDARDPQAVLAFLAEVARRTATLVAHWQRVGFVHGVMNTDNLSILSLTIDYGPYGFLDNFDPDWTPNTTDAQGRRYRYGNQPAVARWNVIRFAEALMPLIRDEPAVVAVLDTFTDQLSAALKDTWSAKLGITLRDAEDEDLLRAMQAALTSPETDFTLFFRAVADVAGAGAMEADAAWERMVPAFYDVDHARAERGALTAWLRRYIARAAAEDVPPAERRARMNRVNPAYVPRNWLAQEAIDAAHDGNMQPLHALWDVMRNPYDIQPGREHFAERRPDWARHKAGCSMLSCSS